MQPCSQPRYGLTERSNGISGDVLRAMIVFACSTVTMVRRRSGSPSSRARSSSQSPSASRAFRLNRVGVSPLAAPRPGVRAGGGCDQFTQSSLASFTLFKGFEQNEDTASKVTKDTVDHRVFCILCCLNAYASTRPHTCEIRDSASEADDRNG